MACETYLGISSERTKTNFASGDGSHRIDDNCNKWFLEILIEHLSGYVNTR